MTQSINDICGEREDSRAELEKIKIELNQISMQILEAE